MIITTTNSIENRPIEKYLGLVSTNLVIGTNIFSDFVASFSDFFGGMSGTYRNQLETLYSRAVEDLTGKAKGMGANAVIGLSIDFDEISGKGKSMFMVSLYGTAVTLAETDSEDGSDAEPVVTLDKLEVEYFKYRWGKREAYHGVNANDWDFILTHNIPEIADSMFEFYGFAMGKEFIGDKEMAKEHFEEYFSKLPRSVAEESAYRHIKDYPVQAIEMIQKYQLFNPDKVLALLEAGDVRNACEFLLSDKQAYSKGDVVAMRKLADAFDNLPDVGHFEETKGGAFSGPKRVYICPKGHKNRDNEEYCSCIDGGVYCGLNIKGMRTQDIKNLKYFKERLSILEDIFGIHANI